MFLLNNIVHRYGEQTVLNLSHWEGTQGTHCLVVGHSGSGKTTLLHLMAGLLTLQQGDITIADQNLGQLSNIALDRFRGQNIGIVFQRQHFKEKCPQSRYLESKIYLGRRRSINLGLQSTFGCSLDQL